VNPPHAIYMLYIQGSTSRYGRGSWRTATCRRYPSATRSASLSSSARGRPCLPGACGTCSATVQQRSRYRGYCKIRHFPGGLNFADTSFLPESISVWIFTHIFKSYVILSFTIINFTETAWVLKLFENIWFHSLLQLDFSLDLCPHSRSWMFLGVEAGPWVGTVCCCMPPPAVTTSHT